MQKIINKLLTAGILGLSVLFLFVLFSKTQIAVGSAPTGLPATAIATSSVSVGPQENIRLSRDYPNCAARIISTQGQAIMLSFASQPDATTTPLQQQQATSTTNLGVNNGVMQLASTTVIYDGGIFGCGYIGAYGFGATTTVNLLVTK